MGQSSRKIKELFFYSFLDLFLNKFFTYLGFFILTLIFSKETIGVLGVAFGYLAFVSYLSIGPESILLRDYSVSKTKKELFQKRVSAYFNFWIVRSVLIFLVGLAIFAFIIQNRLIAVVFIGLLLDKILESFTNLIHILFFVDFKQKVVAKINFFYNLLLLASLTSLFFFSTIYVYLGIIIIGQLFFSLLWLTLFKREFSHVYTYSSQWLHIIKRDLVSFSLWYHASNTVLLVIQQMGPLILSFFASLQVVGEYTIALKIAGFFLIIPQILQKGGIVHYTSETDISLKEQLPKTIFQYVKVHMLLSVVYIVLFIAVGKLGLTRIFGEQESQPIFILTLVMLMGISLYNLFRPFMTFAFASLPTQRGFFSIYAPVGIASPFIYFLSAHYFGALGLAFASIIVYLLLFLFVMFFLFGKKKR